LIKERRTMKRPVGIALAAALAASAFAPLFAEPQAPLELVPRLDPSSYAGKWYEIARFQQGFEKDLVAVKAEYRVRPDGRIDVVNSGLKKSLDGKLSSIKALAWRPDPSKPGALKVRFFGLFASDYLVFGLDDKDYQWAIVGNDSRKFLWFLSRSPSAPPEVFEMMKGIAEGQGYDMSKLYIVPQKERE
jgi:apolipoprotein D and lipocalin family protein